MLLLVQVLQAKPGEIVYGAIPPYFGGQPLKDVERKLPELAELGVDTVWLSPIMQSDDPSAINYSTTDYFSIRPDFGTPDDLKALVREAHERGMKVILDIAPNHVSNQHPFFLDAEEHGQASPYYGYFARDAQGNPQHYFDWTYLINLNYDHPKVQEHITQAFEYWVKEYDVDGFRVDVAWGPRERNPAFWPRLNERLEQLKPGIFMLAEGSARDPYYLQSGFDAAYDWTDKLGEGSWSQVFQDESQIGPRLAEMLNQGPEVLHFLNNNDTGERFITRYGPDKARAAATVLLTLPGIPLVYMGDEVGEQFDPYWDPPPFNWQDPHQLRPHYARLAHLREQVPALASGGYQHLPIENTGSAFAFQRDEVVVIANFGPRQTVHLSLPPGLWRDLLSGKVVQGSQHRMEPGESWVLERTAPPALEGTKP